MQQPANTKIQQAASEVVGNNKSLVIQEKSLTCLDKRLQVARDKIIGIDRQRLGIGTLSEKTLHAILKNTYEPDEDKQEIPIGRFYADIFTGTEIIEIQTAQFNRMREKLTAFLPEYPVTIVYPIAKEKWLYWIDEETGQVSEKRKSPKKGNPYLGFSELYKIKMHLKEPNLRIRFLLLDMEEYKLLNGWGPQKKNNASKYDRIPLEIREEYVMECKEDYMQFVPYDLEEPFTSKTFGKAAHIPRSLAQTTLNILDYMEVVERVGKEGKAYQYRVRY